MTDHNDSPAFLAGTLCLETSREFQLYNERTRWVPAEGSIILLHRDELDYEIGPSGPWPTDLIDCVAQQTKNYLVAAAVQLSALSVLVESDCGIFSIAPIARSAGEACGKAIWLLDPSITVRERSSRWVLDTDADLRSHANVGSVLSDPRAQNLKKVANRLKPILREMYFPEEIQTKNADPNGAIVSLCSQQLISNNELMRFVSNSDFVQNEAAASTYKYLCSLTHCSPLAFAELFEISELADGRRVSTLRASDNTTAKLLSFSLSMFLNAWMLHCVWLGHDFKDIDSLSEGYGRLIAMIE